MNKQDKNVVRKIKEIKAISTNPLPDTKEAAELIKKRTV
jgi:hypothetical protein